MSADASDNAPKCPACGSKVVHASRRHSVFEKLTAFAGISYFRCHECKLRFAFHVGGFASHSMRNELPLMKQRARELLAASALLTIIVTGLVWMLYHSDW